MRRCFQKQQVVSANDNIRLRDKLKKNTYVKRQSQTFLDLPNVRDILPLFDVRVTAIMTLRYFEPKQSRMMIFF